MPRPTTPALQVAFELADAGQGLKDLKEIWERVGSPTSWYNCLKQYKKHLASKEQQQPATPADAAKTGSIKSASDAAKSGNAIAKTVRKPGRIVAEDERRKAAWQEQYNSLHAQATKEVEEARAKGLLGSANYTYAAISAKYHKQLARDSPHRITGNALCLRRRDIRPQSDGRSTGVKSNYKHVVSARIRHWCRGAVFTGECHGRSCGSEQPSSSGTTLDTPDERGSFSRNIGPPSRHLLNSGYRTSRGS
jgi:hypothetical protein